MLEGRSILCFAPEPWHSMWRSRQQIMSRLAVRNKVLFVEPRDHLRPTVHKLLRGQVSLGDLRRPVTRRISDGLTIFRPPLLAPVSGRFPLSAATESARAFLLRRAMSQYGLSAPIVWLERPDVWDQVGKHGALLTVYRVTDEYTAFIGTTRDSKRLTEKWERMILARADLVLPASEALLWTKRIHNPNTHLLPHGVDYAAFARAARGEVVLPGDLEELQRPIIGYVGLVDARLDLALLREVAFTFPHCTLVLVGDVNPLSCEADIQVLRDMKNVCFLGGKPVQDVPAYVSAFDVCLIPYEIAEQSRYANPLKLLEYLAAGKPVVSVNIPAVSQYTGVIRVTDDRRLFLEQVAAALNDRDEKAIARRQEVAAAHSWDRVVERFSALVQTMLDREKS